MDTNSEPSVNQLIEHFRQLYARNLNSYLESINKKKLSNLTDNRGKDSKPLNKNDLEVYDEKGKINWQIIRHILPADIEQHIQRELGLTCENEIRLCCLLIFDVPTKAIAKILTYKPKSIYSTAFSIKKKIGIKEFREIFFKIILNSISIEK